MVRSNIFGTELQSEGAGPYGPVFLNGLQKRPRSGPDRTVASLITVNCQKRDNLVPDNFEDNFEDNFADDFEVNFEDDFEDGINQKPKGNPKRSASTKRKALAKPKKGPAKRPYTKSLKQPKKTISYKELGDDGKEAPDPKKRTREPKKAIHYGV
jgi:hypothetical protein